MIAISPDNGVRTGRGVIPAGTITPGDVVFDENNNPVKVRSVKHANYDTDFVKFGGIFVQDHSVIDGRVPDVVNKDLINRSLKDFSSVSADYVNDLKNYYVNHYGEEKFGDLSEFDSDLSDFTYAFLPDHVEHRGSFIRGVMQYLYDNDVVNRYGLCVTEEGKQIFTNTFFKCSLMGKSIFISGPAGIWATPSDTPALAGFDDTVVRYMPYPGRRFQELYPDEKMGYVTASAINEYTEIDESVFNMIHESDWIHAAKVKKLDDDTMQVVEVTTNPLGASGSSPSGVLGHLIGLGVPWRVATSGEPFLVATHNPYALAESIKALPNSGSTADITFMNSPVHRVNVYVPDLLGFGRNLTPEINDFTTGLIDAGASLAKTSRDDDAKHCIPVMVANEDLVFLKNLTGSFKDLNDGHSVALINCPSVQYELMGADPDDYRSFMFYGDGKLYGSIRTLSGMVSSISVAPLPVAVAAMADTRDYYNMQSLYTDDSGLAINIGAITGEDSGWESASPLVNANSSLPVTVKSSPAFFDWEAENNFSISDIANVLTNNSSELPSVAGLGLMDRHALVELLSPVVTLDDDGVSWFTELVHSVGGDVELSSGDDGKTNAIVSDVSDTAYDMIYSDFVIKSNGGVPERRISAPVIIETNSPNSFIQIGSRGIPVRTMLSKE